MGIHGVWLSRTMKQKPNVNKRQDLGYIKLQKKRRTEAERHGI